MGHDEASPDRAQAGERSQVGAGRGAGLPGTGDGQPSIRPVLDWFTRRLTADRFPNRKRVAVPPELAGWVVPGEGEPADPDGLRPLGAVRDELLALIEKAELPPQERTVLLARTGLSEYPAGTGGRRPLRLRVPVRRRRKSKPEGGLQERRLRMLHDSAIRRLDAMWITDPRPREPIQAGPVSDPAAASWFRDQVPAQEQPRMLERAVDEARSFVAVAAWPGTSNANGAGALKDLDDYLTSLQACTWPPRRQLGRTRAHALVGLALWGLVTAAEHLGAQAAVRSGRPVPPADLVHAPESLGALLAGDDDPQTVLAVCADVLDRASKDRHTAGVLADFLLGYYAQHQGKLPPRAAAAILRTVIHVRSGDEDPTVLGLVQRVITDHPRLPDTIKAAQRAVRVASGHRLFRRAYQLCDFVDEALAHGLSLPPGKNQAVENAEFKLWNVHQRTGTLRRQLDLGMSTDGLKKALVLADEARRRFDEVQTLNTSVVPGDASESWRYFFEVRSAEIHLAASAAADGTTARRHRHMAQRHSLDANVVARSRSRADAAITFIPVAKVDLRAALLLSDEELAAAILWKLHHLGWPLSRTVYPIPAIAVGAMEGPCRLPKVYDTVREIVELEKAADGKSLIADGTNRERWAAGSRHGRTL